MKMFDVNLMIAASRADHPHHALASAAMTELGQGPFAVSPLVVGGFLRIVTHRRAMRPPTPADQAWHVVDVLLSHPHAHVRGPGPAHFEVLRKLCAATSATGVQLADAQHAAVAMEHDCSWWTMDGGFGAFEQAGLRWQLVR